jgi:hypothetical protein
MLRLRRTLAFGSRVHNYLLLLYLFILSLFATQLWWDTTEQFQVFTHTSAIFVAAIGIAYAVLLLVIALILSLIDRIVPFLDIVTTILRGIAFGCGWLFVSLISRITEDGLVFYF